MKPFKFNESLGQAISEIGLILSCCLLVLINGRFGAPIWIDEFLHFALGSYNSFQEAWDVISKTTTGINHGQTGTYMIIDYWLLKEFGASALALRIPSLISSFWLLFCGLLILRMRRLKMTWQYLLIILLFSQTVLMRYVGEARPYMPLAAAAVGCLLYYLMPLSIRKNWWAIAIGAISIVLGVLMHPYFSVYWAFLWLYAYWNAIFTGHLQFSRKSLLQHVNVPLTVLGVALFMAVGMLTWMRGRPDFLFNPFQWLNRETVFDTFINYNLFQFLSPLGWVFLAANVLIMISYPLVNANTRVMIKPLIPPIVLILLMTFLAIGLSLVSYITDYWILERQWIASIAIIPIASVQLLFEISRLVPKEYSKRFGLLFAAVFVVLGIRVYLLNAEKVEDLFIYLNSVNELAVEPVSTFNGSTPTNNDEWVALARQNIEQGGPVWPVFRKFYRLNE